MDINEVKNRLDKLRHETVNLEQILILMVGLDNRKNDRHL